MPLSSILNKNIVFWSLTTLLALSFQPNLALATPPQSISLIFHDKNFALDEATLESWQQPTTIPAQSLVEIPTIKNAVKTFTLNPKTVYEYLEALSSQINEASIEPKLTIVNNRAVEFIQPKNGIKLDVFSSALEVISKLESGSKQIVLKEVVSTPKTSLGSLNSLGIKELIATGESKFNGSPKNRRHNIQVGVEKMKGIILAPNEEFSFNKFLGPVEEDQGFVPELVIKKEGTIPELGGGLCQVSSTTFRAAMTAGLPIKERKNHAYAVQYYAPQGTDATIYPGSVDLRFTNDTPGNILIWPYFKNKDTLVFDFYGTKDNRIVTLSKPYQYDKKEDGSMKATWEREVIKDGKTRNDVFKSVYQSPALFHKEEKFVSASTTTPTTNPISQ